MHLHWGLKEWTPLGREGSNRRSRKRRFTRNIHGILSKQEKRFDIKSLNKSRTRWFEDDKNIIFLRCLVRTQRLSCSGSILALDVLVLKEHPRISFVKDCNLMLTELRTWLEFLASVLSTGTECAISSSKRHVYLTENFYSTTYIQMLIDSSIYIISIKIRSLLLLLESSKVSLQSHHEKDNNKWWGKEITVIWYRNRSLRSKLNGLFEDVV